MIDTMAIRFRCEKYVRISEIELIINDDDDDNNANNTELCRL